MKSPSNILVAGVVGLALLSSAGCLEFSPSVGGRPLTDEERAAWTDTGVDAAVAPNATSDAALDVADTARVSFARQVRPLLRRLGTDPSGKGCYPCHDGTASKHVGVDLGGFDLSTLAKLREGGGSSGARIVVPFDPASSALVQKLRGTYPFGSRMPKSGPPFWTDADIELVERWIREGAQGGDEE